MLMAGSMDMDMDLVTAEEKRKGKVDMDLWSDLKATAEENEKEKKGDKVCVMLGLNSYIGIFMLNLDKDPDLNKKGEFAEIEPNLIVDLSFVPHVVKDTLYLFDYLPHTAPRVYSIKLEAVSNMAGRRFDMEEVTSETEFTRLSDCLGPKPIMRSLSYRDRILLFSSEIYFHYYDDQNGDKYQCEEFHSTLKDFELYDPEACKGKGKSRELPQLIVCIPRFSSANPLKLYDSLHSKYYDHDFPALRSCTGHAFSIVAFGVDVGENKLIIETELGRMFSLKLDGTDELWRLCEEDYEFVADSNNIVTTNGICLDAYGANDCRTRWRKQQQQEQSRQEDDTSQEDASSSRVSFPPFLRDIERCGLVSRHGRDSSAFDFLKLNGDPSSTFCIVRQAFSPIRRGTSDGSFFFLDVLELNLLKLEKEFSEKEFTEKEFPDIKDYDKFMKQIRSFKYYVPGMIYIPSPFVPGVFYY